MDENNIRAALTAADEYAKQQYARDIATGRGPRTSTDYNATRWNFFSGYIGSALGMTDPEIRALIELPVDEYTANRVESARWMIEDDARLAAAEAGAA